MKKCRACGKPVNGGIVDDKGNVYCNAKCYETFLPKCIICGKTMQQWIEDEVGKKYCSQKCFETKLPKCDMCGKPVTQGFTDKSGKIYCSNECFEKTLPRCSVCGKLMREWLIDDNGRKFCSEACFETILPKCSVCGKPVRDGYTDELGKFYCSDKCRESVLPTCVICGKRVESGYTDETGNIYCSEECYDETLPKCLHCGKPLREWIQTENGEHFCNEDCLNSYLEKIESLKKNAQMDVDLTSKELAFITGLTENECKTFMDNNNLTGDDALEVIDIYIQALNDNIAAPIQVVNMLKNANIYSKLASRLSEYNVMRGGTKGFGGFVFEELHATDQLTKGVDISVLGDNGIADFKIIDKSGNVTYAQAKAGYKKGQIDWSKYKDQTIVMDKGNPLIEEARNAGLKVIESSISKAEANALARWMQLEAKITGNKNAPVVVYGDSIHRAGLDGVKFATRVAIPLKLGETLYDVVSGDVSLEDAVPEFAKDSAKMLGVWYLNGVISTAVKDVTGIAAKQIAKTAIGKGAQALAVMAGKTVVGGKLMAAGTGIVKGIGYVTGAISGPVGWVAAACVAIGFGCKYIKDHF